MEQSKKLTNLYTVINEENTDHNNCFLNTMKHYSYIKEWITRYQ